MLTQLDQVLGSTTKVQLLRALAPLTDPVSGREATRLGRVRSKAGAQRALDELSDLHVFDRTPAGGSRLYSMNPEHHLYGALVELFEAERRSLSVLRDAVVRALDEADRSRQVLSVIVFGSMARAEANAKSDLDLLVITRQRGTNAGVEQALRSIANPIVRRRLGLLVSPYVLAKAEIKKRYDNGDPLMKTIMAEGRTLVGDNLKEVIAAW